MVLWRINSNESRIVRLLFLAESDGFQIFGISPFFASIKMRVILSFEQHRLNIGAETIESHDQKRFPKLYFRRVKSKTSEII